eukprot:NODE_1291_length_983_cov_232.132762_g992_i0.p1 GENE.NODE_1291_length_983_cov_232.132762_g992_i0~~NODE_1291_length_983_cov_232.132762_g992_i0.p1  ORF type:complete len:257 (-),score=56.54 NODE_1291_length_983_cov_232.132762_g992_i0:132-902(-)
MQAARRASAALSSVKSRKSPACITSFYFLKSSKKKVSPFIVWIRGMTVKEAMMQCLFHKKRAANLVSALLRKAQDNAEETLKVSRDRLVVASSLVKIAACKKEIRFVGRGRIHIHRRPYVHISVKVKEATQAELTAIEEYQANKKKEQNIKQHLETWAYENKDAVSFQVAQKLKQLDESRIRQTKAKFERERQERQADALLNGMAPRRLDELPLRKIRVDEGLMMKRYGPIFRKPVSYNLKEFFKTAEPVRQLPKE